MTINVGEVAHDPRVCGKWCCCAWCVLIWSLAEDLGVDRSGFGCTLVGGKSLVDLAIEGGNGMVRYGCWLCVWILGFGSAKDEQVLHGFLGCCPVDGGLRSFDLALPSLGGMRAFIPEPAL